MAVALLPVVAAVAVYRGRSHETTSVLEIADDQIAATIPDGIEVESPLRAATSGNRRTVAYVGTKGAEQCLCANNSVVRCSAGIGTIVVSGDGERIAWAESSPNRLTGEIRWRVVTDGDPGPDYLEIRNLQLAAETGKPAYVARSAEGCRYVFEGRQGKVYTDIRWSVLSPDGSRSFYLSTGDSQLTPVLDGVAGPPFHQLIAYSFSRTGRHLAYAGRDSDGTFLILDGQRTSVPPELADVALNADGSRLCRTFKSPAGVWFAEGDRTSQVFRAQSASVSFSPAGTILIALSMQDNAPDQVWSGDDVTKLRRSRGLEIGRLFDTIWSHAMVWDQTRVSGANGGNDGYNLAWVERDGRQLRWRRLHLPPTHITKIDMAPAEPGLEESRDAVLSALKDRSVERLLAYVDPDVRAGFGEPCCGAAYFRSAYNLDDRSSPFWAQAQQVIENGGRLGDFQGTLTFTAPYTFGLAFGVLGPFFGVDRPYAIGFVKGNGTKLRAGPQPESTALKTFDWEPAAFLPFANGDPGSADLEKRWARVRTLDGHEGYIERGNIASGLDLRATFAKRDGRWLITAFVSGD